jgi:hypothetical protein
MRKWLWIGTLGFTLGSVGGYWYFTTQTTGTNSNRESDDVNRVVLNDKNDGDAEASEEIEPLIVDPGKYSVQNPAAPVDDGPMPRVVREPGMKQPPRPDAAPGRVPRMPYADEEEFLAVTLDPIKRILESTLPRLGIFEEIDKSDAADESEKNGANPSVARPEGNPPMNDHHQHCPYNHGHCPPPYSYRPMARD